MGGNQVESSSKSDTVSRKAATVIIIGIVLFVLAFFGLGTYFLFFRLQQPEARQERDLLEDYANAAQEEPEVLAYDEPIELAEENGGANEAAHDYLDEPDVHPLVGIWRLVYTTDHVNADMLDYGFVFYWHACEDGTAKSRMYSPHSGWHTKEEYTWSITDEGQLEEVLTYVNIQATEMYLGPEFAAMIDGAIGMVMTSNYEIDQDTFTLTMPNLTLVYQRADCSPDSNG